MDDLNRLILAVESSHAAIRGVINTIAPKSPEMDRDTLGQIFAEVLEPETMMEQVRQLNTSLGNGPVLDGYNFVRAYLVRLARKHRIETEWTR